MARHVAILLGAEFNAETQRERAIRAADVLSRSARYLAVNTTKASAMH